MEENKVENFGFKEGYKKINIGYRAIDNYTSSLEGENFEKSFESAKKLKRE